MSSANNFLFAYKAFAVAPDLSANDRRVAGAIVDHFNKKTGQCDPSIERLSALLGVDEKSVRRATTRLCERGLFKKASHGGKSHRASYLPCWVKFQEIVDDWELRMRSRTRRDVDRDSRAEMSSSTGQEGPVEPDKNARQTHRANPLNEPFLATDGARGNVSNAWPQRADEQSTVSRPKRGDGHRNGSGWHIDRLKPCRPLQRHQISHSQAADAAAERRWYADLHALGPELEADAIERLTQEAINAVTAAERHQRGAGIRVIHEALWMRSGARLS
ncbi:helix-turn-helix domain-containing protein [Rhizobium sp. H4]|uniref:helix-turn-helix domain-containing protein n=1 Tax=Rhizobium sp. H4 TaxID=2035449 RepID=UPI000D10AC0B|nr:helix-turn-helix domain-containing protein [Rhizobium sp. H4]